MSATTPTGAGIAADNTPPDRLLSSVVSAMADCVAEVERLRAALESIGGMTMSMCLSTSDMAGRMKRIAQEALAPKEPSE